MAEEESVRGVAGGVTVKLVGSVVFRIKMFKKGPTKDRTFVFALKLLKLVLPTGLG